MTMTVKLVRVNNPLITLNKVPFWSECLVTFMDNGESKVSTRFHHPYGCAAYIDSGGQILRYGSAFDYTVMKILGPKPANNDQPKSSPSKPMKFGELPKWVWVIVKYGDGCSGLRCHDGHGHVFSIHHGHLLMQISYLNDYTFDPDAERWELEFEGVPNDTT